MSGVKKISDYIPILEDQGMAYLAGAGQAGVSVQSCAFTMPGGGAFTFAGAGLQNMFDGNYQVFIQDNTTATAAKAASKTALGFTISGPSTSDVLDVIVVGRLATQAA